MSGQDARIETDVVVVGAGAAGLPAAISAREGGAEVVVLERNYDVGGHAILSKGNVRLGGGTSWQTRYGIDDSPDQLFLDHTDHRYPEFRRSDRSLVRAWADTNVETFEFLLASGVQFRDEAPTVLSRGSTPRVFTAIPSSDDWVETVNGGGGSGVIRPLQRSAIAKGVDFRLSHEFTGLIRESEARGGRVRGVSATDPDGRRLLIHARRGVVLATGGHTSNVAFRQIFDARLTEEYHTAGEPWSQQTAAGEIAALEVGASLWGVGIQAAEYERTVHLSGFLDSAKGGSSIITKTVHIGCRWGYRTLKWDPRSPVFPTARATGLTVTDFQDVVLVNQTGRRFWDELDSTSAFVNACLGTNGSLGRGEKTNGGGPIWAIFDASAARREGWDPRPPHVDPDGWFFEAPSIPELATRIRNPHQLVPIPPENLAETIDEFNQAVTSGKDPEFGRDFAIRSNGDRVPNPSEHRLLEPPFYAAWATPILHDSVTGLRIDAGARVLDIAGEVIPGLYAAGEVAGGFGLHGVGRSLVFGRIAGLSAASAS